MDWRIDAGSVTLDPKHQTGVARNALWYVYKNQSLGVEFMHKTGYLHRDICPRNVMVNKEGVVKIIDLAMRLAPYGVFGLIFFTTSRFGWGLSMLTCSTPSTIAFVVSAFGTCGRVFGMRGKRSRRAGSLPIRPSRER